MQLLRPDLTMKDAFADFTRDWETHNEPIAPISARLDGRIYETWLEDTWRLENEPRGNYVPADTWFWFDGDGRMAGMITLRHMLNDFLLRVGGHIGYGVRPSMRRQGHATAMLAAVLPRARELGLTRVLVSCHRENVGSARTIQKNGGMLENEIVEDGRIVQRYWIVL